MPSIPHTRPGKWPKAIPPGRMAAQLRRQSPEGCALALLGLPDDAGVKLNHGRPGAAGGPQTSTMITQVGFNIARYLSNEDNDVTVIDRNETQIDGLLQGRMGAAGEKVLPVVSRANVQRLVGVVTLADVLATLGVAKAVGEREAGR